MTIAYESDHPIRLEPAAGRIRVRCGDTTIADTRNALVMQETVYPPIFYIPREDVSAGALVASAHTTRCPFKGIASYYSIAHDGGTVENAVWSYENPLEPMADIMGYLAFYPRHVAFIEGED